MYTAIRNEIKVVPYSKQFEQVWNDWIAESKNATFLLNRNFMEYHADRHVDASLLFFENDQLAGVLPASLYDETLMSHGGLTYGGFALSKKSKGDWPLRAMDALVKFCQAEGIKRILYKPIPAIYHEVPAEEDLYALFRYSAKLIRRDLSSAIRMDSQLPYSKGRKYALSLARKAGLRVETTGNFRQFFEMEEHVLARHNTKPVHTAQEMERLTAAFPNNIRLYTVHDSSPTLLAGVLVFESKCVAHAQYMGCAPEGREIGALDVAVDFVITNSGKKRYFDFGISTEQAGHHLNEGLLAQKEMFGARSVVYDQYYVDI